MNQDSLCDEKIGSSGAGCLRGCFVAILAPVVAVFVGIWVGGNHGWFNGVMSGIGAFLIVCLAAALICWFCRPRLTILDCITPVIISIFPAVLFFPLRAAELDVFSPVDCIGAGFLLTLSLWSYRSGKIAKGWLILPALCFAYECLPVNLPTMLDDWLALGGSAASLWIGRTMKKTLIEDSICKRIDE